MPRTKPPNTDVEEASAQLRLAQEALHKSEELLGQAVRVADLGIFDHDMVAETLYWSPRLREIFGYHPTQAPTLGEFTAAVHASHRPVVEESIRRAHDPSGDGVWEVEIPIHVRGDETRWITARAQTFFAGEGGGRRAVRTVGAVRDITARVLADEERVRLQARLEHAQRLESVGRLAGGVAHDFNNTLTVILGHLEVMLLSLPETSRLRDDLTEVQHAARRSAELTQQLLAFARKQNASPRVVDLNAVVERSLRMLRRLIGEGVSLTWEPANDLCPVRIDPMQVERVLANLATNARDAIGGHGRVTIRSARVTLGAGAGAAPGEYARVTVHDDGAGMDADTLAHAFEPFFTTKPDGRGTGLGLATVYGVIKQNGGHVDVESRVGAGTTVTLLLPACAPGEVERARPEALARVEVGDEALLLVEDEPQVRDVTRALLEHLGYSVTVAATPSEALAMLPTLRVDLLVTDVTMPEMNGSELYRQAVRLRPGLPCLFVSAHPSQMLSEQGLVPDGVHMLQKPYSLRDLGARVRVALRRV